VEKSFQVGAGTMDRTYKQAMGALSSAAIDLGENMAPLIDDFADLAKQASRTARAYNELDDYWKGLIDSAAISVLAVGPLLYALGSLARIMARFTGLSILFKAAWIKNAAGMMLGKTTADLVGASMTRLGMTKLQLAGSIGTALVAGYQFGKWLDHTLGITDKLNKSIGEMHSSLDSVTDGMKGSEAGIDGAAYAARQLAVRLGEVELSTQLVSAAQAGNVVEIAKLIKKINEKAQAYNKAHIAVDGLTKSEEDHKNQQDAIREAEQELAAEEAERLKKLREMHGLMTSDEVTAKMAEMSGHYKDHLDNGVKQEMINERFVDDWQELLGLAREYGVATTQAFKNIGESMRDQGLIENSEFYRLFDYYIPQAINAIPGKILPAMLEVNGVVADNLKGGMDKDLQTSTRKCAQGHCVGRTLWGRRRATRSDPQHGLADVADCD
jgi:hypothetical protein